MLSVHETEAIPASMDARTASMAHPSFVEIIKQLTPDEARLLRFFATGERLPMITVRAETKDGRGGQDISSNVSLFGRDANCDHPHLTPSYIDNLSRLGLIEIPGMSYTAADAYEELENDPSVVEMKDQIEATEDFNVRITRKMVQVTQLGKQFIKACVIDHRELQQPESPALPDS